MRACRLWPPCLQTCPGSCPACPACNALSGYVCANQDGLACALDGGGTGVCASGTCQVRMVLCMAGLKGTQPFAMRLTQCIFWPGFGIDVMIRGCHGTLCKGGMSAVGKKGSTTDCAATAHPMLCLC